MLEKCDQDEEYYQVLIEGMERNYRGTRSWFEHWLDLSILHK